MGAPSFAHFAKDGNLERMRDGVQSHKSCVGSIVTRPYKKHKDGAPSAPLAHTDTDIIKGWATRLASLIRGIRKLQSTFSPAR